MSDAFFTMPELPATRDLGEMMRDARVHGEAPALVTRTIDGWCRSVGHAGFRHDYDINIARGGWEFHQLDAGLSVAITDMVPLTNVRRQHISTDCLVLTAMIDGAIPLSDDDGGGAAEMTTGFCTVYGQAAGESVRTLYESGRHLRWISVFIDRTAIGRIVPLDRVRLPADLAAFVAGAGRLPSRNVLLPAPAQLVVQQMADNPFEDGLRDTYLHAKAHELVCHVLAVLVAGARHQLTGNAAAMSPGEVARIRKAWRMMRAQVDRPPNIPDIAAAVGMTRQRLQHGFKLLYGDTVARVRDRLRMQLALSLVVDSEASMIEITFETGYEHPASFTRAFRAAHGLSPAQMRKAARAVRPHDQGRVS